jgi:hypothetical protein
MSYNNPNIPLQGGTIVAVSPYNAGPETIVAFDGLEIKWHNSSATSSDGIAIRTQSGSRNLRYSYAESYVANAAADSGRTLWGASNAWYAIPGVGAVATTINTTYPYSQVVTTTFIGMGNPAMPNSSLRQYFLYDDTNSVSYRITTDKQASTGEVTVAQVGTCSIVVEKIGIALAAGQTITSGYGIALNNGQITDANRIAKTSPMGSAIAGTTVSLGELSFRYSSTASTGNLDIQSSSATAVAVRTYGEEFFPAVATTRNMTYLAGTAPATGTTWLNLPVGGLGVDEMLNYEIFTATNVYRVRLYSFAASNVHLIVEKAV